MPSYFLEVTFDSTRAETLMPTKQTQELKDSHLPGAGLGLRLLPAASSGQTSIHGPESRQPGIDLRDGLAFSTPYISSGWTTPVVRAVSLLLPSPQLMVYIAGHPRDEEIPG